MVEYVDKALALERHTRVGTQLQLLASIQRVDDRISQHEKWHQTWLEGQISETIRAKQYLVANILAILAMLGTVLGVVIHSHG